MRAALAGARCELEAVEASLVRRRGFPPRHSLAVTALLGAAFPWDDQDVGGFRLHASGDDPAACRERVFAQADARVAALARRCADDDARRAWVGGRVSAVRAHRHLAAPVDGRLVFEVGDELDVLAHRPGWLQVRTSLGPAWFPRWAVELNWRFEGGGAP